MNSSNTGDTGFTLWSKTGAALSNRLINLAIELSSYGQYPYSISYTRTPNDQISALIVQISPFRISGAMQIGDPSIVCARSLLFSKLLQNPKSPIFIQPLWKKIFPGFKSRCMIFFAVRTLNASIICDKYPSTADSGITPIFLIFCSRVPSLQNSQKKQKLLAVLRISMNLTMQGQLILLRIQISLRVHCQSFLFSLNLLMWTTLTATGALVLVSMPRQTLPYQPSPICSQIVQFQMILTI